MVFNSIEFKIFSKQAFQDIDNETIKRKFLIWVHFIGYSLFYWFFVDISR